jgi:transcriptional/translational regulatory protein YebC/TACO1
MGGFRESNSVNTLLNLLTNLIELEYSRVMSGHNKYSKIKHKKALTDAKKSKIFTKMSRFITEEAKKAGGNLSSPGLRAAIDKARESNMPNDSIDRAVKKATATGGAAMEAITYESYGPGGVAIVIDALTDNRNKAAQEVKFILSQYGAELAAMGAATWAFEKKNDGWMPNTTVPVSGDDLTKLMALIEALEDNDEVQDVYTNAETTEEAHV